MAKTSTSKTPTFFHQDTFDKATIKVLHELQKLGFCKNVTSIEEHLEIPKRNLWQAINGHRHVSKLYRSRLLQFFVNNYNVNPGIFSRLTDPVFKVDPPTMAEQQEPYFTKGESNVISMGDFAMIDRLKKEVADKDAKIRDLQKELKYWRGLAQKGLSDAVNGGTGKKKTGRKNGQKSTERR